MPYFQTSHLVIKPAINCIFLRIKADHYFAKITLVILSRSRKQPRLSLLSGSTARNRSSLIPFGNICGCYDILARKVDCVPLTRQKSRLVHQSRDPVHLDQILYVLLYIQPLGGNFELLMV